MKLRTLFSGLFMATLLSGCGLIYTNIHIPYAYHSATPADVKADKSDTLVTGKACSSSYLFLVDVGNSGYAAAVHEALHDSPTAILYDVKTDIKVQSVLLGLYSKTCTIVTGKVGHS